VELKYFEDNRFSDLVQIERTLESARMARCKRKVTEVGESGHEGQKRLHIFIFVTKQRAFIRSLL
jgi:hypothetical protein